MQRTGSRTIQLADLNRYIFTDEYVAPVGSNGRPELTFLGAGGEHTFDRAWPSDCADVDNGVDADAFWEVIVGLAQLELPDSHS